MGNRKSRPRETCPEKKIVHWWGDCYFCYIKTMVELKVDNRTYFCCRPCIRKYCTQYTVANPHLFICQKL